MKIPVRSLIAPAIALVILGAVFVYVQKDTAVDEVEALVVRPMSAGDHIRGSLDARVHIILFSDPECPYCKEWHENVLPRIEQKFGDDVAIAYRHRLVSRYQRSEREAHAMECADVIGGNEAFWRYADIIFRETPSDDRLPPEKLFDFARQAGLPVTQFTACIESEERRERIARDVQEAAVAEIAVSPTALVMLKDGSRSVMVPTSRYGPIEAAVQLLLGARDAD